MSMYFSNFNFSLPLQHLDTFRVLTSFRSQFQDLQCSPTSIYRPESAESQLEGPSQSQVWEYRTQRTTLNSNCPAGDVHGLSVKKNRPDSKRRPGIRYHHHWNQYSSSSVKKSRYSLLTIRLTIRFLRHYHNNV